MTKVAAEAALRLALRDRARFDVGGDITSNTRVSVLAEAWFAGLKNLSPTAMQAYRNRPGSAGPPWPWPFASPHGWSWLAVF